MSIYSSKGCLLVTQLNDKLNLTGYGSINDKYLYFVELYIYKSLLSKSHT